MMHVQILIKPVSYTHLDVYKRQPKTLSLGQYGMTRGVDRILSILKERGIKATFFTPGWVAEQYPDKLKKIKEEGHEIASLAYKHENMALLTEEEQEEVMKKGIEAVYYTHLDVYKRQKVK